MNEHYIGFINTCVGFGMGKEAADTLYKRASKFRAVRGAISAIRKAMGAGKGLNTVMYNGKALAENGRKMNQLRTFLGRARNSKYFANPEEAAKMRQFLGMGAPKPLPAATGGGALVPSPARAPVPTGTTSMVPARGPTSMVPTRGTTSLQPGVGKPPVPQVNNVSPPPYAAGRPPVNTAGGDYIDVESHFVNPSQQGALARREAIKARFSARRAARTGGGGTPPSDGGRAARAQGIKDRFAARRQAARTGGPSPDPGVQPQVPADAVNQMAAGATPAAGGNFFASHPFLTTMGIAVPSYMAGRIMTNRSNA